MSFFPNVDGWSKDKRIISARFYGAMVLFICDHVDFTYELQQVLLEIAHHHGVDIRDFITNYDLDATFRRNLALLELHTMH